MSQKGNAIGLIETSSIARGFAVADAVMKAADVEIVVNRTICPGKYMVLIGGEVDSVSASIEAGVEAGAHTVVDHFVIANIHPDIYPAISGVNHVEDMKALGVVESFSVASIIEGADAAAKAADITFLSIHLAMAIGGKAYASFTGDVASVQAAADAAEAVVSQRGQLVDKVVIPRPCPEIVREFI